MNSINLPSTSLNLLADLANGMNGKEVWTRFLALYRPLVISWLHRAGLQPVDSEEVYSRLLVRLFTSIISYKPELGRFRSWLKTVVLNLVRSYWRELQKPGAKGTGESEMHEAISLIEMSRELESFVGELDERLPRDLPDLRILQEAMTAVQREKEVKTWEAFRLTILEERPAKEVAAVLSLKLANVYIYKKRVWDSLEAKCKELQARRAAGALS